MPKLVRILLVTLGLLLAAWPSGALRADDDDRDHEVAHRLLSEGRIKPLSELMEVLKGAVPGEVLQVEFENENGLYAYEFKVLRPDGRVQEVEIDAATGQVRKVEDEDDN